jgi:type IV pilus assembly protein PilA
MFKKAKVLKNEKGLTLIELLAVLVILGIIAAIAIPAIGNIIEDSREDAVKQDAIKILEAASLYKVEDPANQEFTPVDLETAGYLQLNNNKFDAAIIDISGPNPTIDIDNVEVSGSRSLSFETATIEDINGHETGSNDTTIGD